MLPKVFQRLLLRCSQTTGLAAGKSVIDDLVDDRIVHRCRFGKEGGHHGELYGNGVRPSKSRPHGDHCIGNPGNQEASTNQHCHLTQGKWETVGSENSWTIQSVWQAWRRGKSFIPPLPPKGPFSSQRLGFIDFWEFDTSLIPFATSCPLSILEFQCPQRPKI